MFRTRHLGQKEKNFKPESLQKENICNWPKIFSINLFSFMFFINVEWSSRISITFCYPEKMLIFSIKDINL